MRRWIWRIGKGLALALVLFVTVVIVDGWTAFGKQATGARLSRMEHSPAWRAGQFANPQPLHNDPWLMLKGFFRKSAYGSPSEPPPTISRDRASFAVPPATGLRVTWLGHSTMLVEIDGRRVLTDPVWGERVSPLTWMGPRRWFAPPLPLAELPPVDAVIISHDHYDHLDFPTISAMRHWDTTFVVPLGVGAHLEYWGVPAARIVELDWWQETEVKGLRLVATPARHASGRAAYDNNETLWAGWAMIGPRHRAYFSGDTGLFPGLVDIGERLGPFDVTLIESGAYNRAWPDWHLGPEQAVRAHQMVRGRLMIPVHWGLFNLAYHAWTEPAERVLAEAAKRGVTVAVPRAGQSVEPGAPPVFERWWPVVPGKTAAEDPIEASQVDPESAI
jgi:L-ascorbate metabolism protein UlaG (beta-lactamase superfamily)